MSDLARLSTVLAGCVAVPVHGDSSPFILPSFTEVVVTPLQEGVLQSLTVIEKEVCYNYYQFSFYHIYIDLYVFFSNICNC